MKRKKHPGGRPLFDGKDKNLVIAKLERVFAAGGTDQCACLYAGISPDALYRYEKKFPKFRERKEALKGSPELRARLKVNREISHNVYTAQWYLERKVPDEFSRQLKLGGTDGGSIKIEDPAANAWAEKILQALIDQQSPIRSKVAGDKKAGRK